MNGDLRREAWTRARTALFGLSAMGLAGCHTLGGHGPTAPRPEAINRPLRPGEIPWAHLPNAQDAFALFPEQAKRAGIQGQVSVRCRVQPTGFLTRCAVIAEAPAGNGFGAATLRLVRLFQLEPGRYGRKATLEVPITWRLRHAP